MNVTTIDAAEQADRIMALYREIFPGADIGSLVGGKILPGSGAQLELTDPASGQVFARYADAGAAEIDAAMAGGGPAARRWMGVAADAAGRR
ncbi:aldehyde dehydrogenase, partial [Paracoccus versutus]|nr:aldehyde dehydrogenase [Paracoccus versutus]